MKLFHLVVEVVDMIHLHTARRRPGPQSFFSLKRQLACADRAMRVLGE